MNYIEHIREPKKLLLCWQAPEKSDRRKHIIAELCRKENSYIFRYLKGTEDFERAEKLGFKMYPAFKADRQEHTSGVLEAFVGRIPPRSRKDFNEYLQSFRIPENTHISYFALLGYSGAKLPSDGFSIIDPFEGVNTPNEFLIELAGTRYMKELRLSDIHPDDLVELVKEPDNKYDPQAIFVTSKGRKLGYINRGQTQAFHRWMASDNIRLLANVERKNGNEERPIVYIFVRLLPNNT